MSRHTNNLYDQAFYEAHTTRTTYVFLAKFLIRVFRPKSAIDFGCGIGEVLRLLQSTGITVLGVEGSVDALNFVRIDVQVADLSQPITLDKVFDLAISTEVAEHLPPASSENFVASIVQHAKGHVFFTAAQPGQGGTGHINCQTKEYWADLFARHGYRKSRSSEFVAKIALFPLIWELPWIRNNAQVFVKSGHVGLRALLFLPVFATEAAYWRLRISRIGGAKKWSPRLAKSTRQILK